LFVISGRKIDAWVQKYAEIEISISENAQIPLLSYQLSHIPIGRKMARAKKSTTAARPIISIGPMVLGKHIAPHYRNGF
jgi:hypothetical protein